MNTVKKDCNTIQMLSTQSPRLFSKRLYGYQNSKLDAEFKIIEMVLNIGSENKVIDKNSF
jgi:hypothetical protein